MTYSYLAASAIVVERRRRVARGRVDCEVQGGHVDDPTYPKTGDSEGRCEHGVMVMLRPEDGRSPVSYTAGSGVHECTEVPRSQYSVSSAMCLPLCNVPCLQPYLAKAEAWRKELKYGRAAHSSDGSMQIVDKSPEAVVGSPTEFVLWPMPTSTAAD